MGSEKSIFDTIKEVLKEMTENVINIFSKTEITKEKPQREGVNYRFNSLGSTKENTEKEINNYLNSKHISPVDKEELKNDKEFLSLLEEKFNAEDDIRYIKEQISELKYDFIEVDDSLNITDNVGSQRYNEELQKLESRLEKAELTLRYANNKLDDKLADKPQFDNRIVLDDLIKNAANSSKEKEVGIKEVKPMNFER